MLFRLTGLTPEIRFRLNAPDEGRGVIRHWYTTMGAPMGVTGWAQTFWSTPTTALISAMYPDYEGALVISIEMSPLMEGVLEALGIPWIDVGISPRRFLADLPISLKTSRHFNPHCAPDCLLSAAELTSAIELVRRRYGHINTSSLEGTTVFFAQTKVDRTLIHEGRMPAAEEILDHVTAALNGRRLLIKPHPLALGNPILARLKEKHSATLCDLNTYAILASRQNLSALTWSSSVGLEASAFGLPSVTLAPKVQSWSYGGVETVRWGRSVRLWEPLLSAVLPIAKTDDLEPWRPNDLRSELGTFGFDATIWAGEATPPDRITNA